jgi:hypothetical protein
LKKLTLSFWTAEAVCRRARQGNYTGKTVSFM